MYKGILVPIDGSTTSMNGLEKAMRLSKASGAKLWILHVVDGVAYIADDLAGMVMLDVTDPAAPMLVR